MQVSPFASFRRALRVMVLCATRLGLRRGHMALQRARPPNPSDKKQNVCANQILAGLPKREFDQLQPKLRRVDFELKDVLYEAKSELDAAYFVESGLISLIAVMRTGEELEVGVVGREGLVGAEITLGGSVAMRRTLVQGAPMVAYRISAEALRRAFRDLPEFQARVLRFVRGQSLMASQTAACNALHDVEERLAKWLLMCRDRADGDTLGLTQEFLATMLGVRRTTVTLVAKTLHDSGSIEYKRGKITILKRNLLEKASCECYEVLREG
jgi:CRP-like cAMP-binding protein